MYNNNNCFFLFYYLFWSVIIVIQLTGSFPESFGLLCPMQLAQNCLQCQLGDNRSGVQFKYCRLCVVLLMVNSCPVPPGSLLLVHEGLHGVVEGEHEVGVVDGGLGAWKGRGVVRRGVKDSPPVNFDAKLLSLQVRMSSSLWWCHSWQKKTNLLREFRKLS